MQKCEPDINCKLTMMEHTDIINYDGALQKCEPDINCKLTMMEH